MVFTKKAAAMANKELGVISQEVGDYIIKACDLILETSKCMDQFPSDVYQGGAGTSVNMNTNEVIANLALELMGKEKGLYAALFARRYHGSPNASRLNHVAVLSGFVFGGIIL